MKTFSSRRTHRRLDNSETLNVLFSNRHNLAISLKLDRSIPKLSLEIDYYFLKFDLIRSNGIDKIDVFGVMIDEAINMAPVTAVYFMFLREIKNWVKY